MKIKKAAKHTPRPWKAGRSDMATIVDGHDSKWIYAGEKYVAVASGRDVPWGEVMANSHLIEAAPDLLAELIAQKAWMEQFIFIPGAPQALGEYRLKTAQDRYDKLCAAIAKGEGR